MPKTIYGHTGYIDPLDPDTYPEPTLKDKLETALNKTAIEKTLEERGNRYGEFSKHAEITQRLKEEMQRTDNWHCLTYSMKESLEMLAHKIGRILNGDPFYHDSWHDIVGYAKLVADELEGKK